MTLKINDSSNSSPQPPLQLKATLRDQQEKIREIARRINVWQAKDDACVTQLNELLNMNDWRTYQLDRLGVSGGSFGYASNDNSMFSLMLKYVSEYQNDTRPMAFIPRASQEYSKLFDFMIGGIRDDQPLLRGNNGGSPFAPEFYWHFPVNMYLESPILPWTAPLKDETVELEKQFQMIYCPLGEILFFLFAWRMLFRSISQYGRAYNVRGKTDWLEADLFAIFPNHNGYDFWKQTSDYPKNYPTWYLPEEAWCSHVKELRASNAPIAQRVVKQWEEASQFDRLSSADEEQVLKPFCEDWINLGLVKFQSDIASAAKIRKSLISLLSYARWLKDELENAREPKMDMSSSLASLSPSLEEVVRMYKEDVEMEASQLSEIDRWLRHLVFCFFSQGDNEPLPLIRMLGKLHRTARFPVISMFYKVALVKRVTTHIVIPVEVSHTNRVRVDLPETNQQMYMTNECVVVGAALLDIYPLSGMDWTCSGWAKETREESEERLECIVQLYQKVGAPLGDAFWQQFLIKPKERREQDEKAARRQFHESGYIIQALFDRWVRSVRDLFEVQNVERPVAASSERIGRLELWNDIEITEEDLGIIPFKRYMWNVSQSLTFWSDSEDPKHIPFYSEQNIDLHQFVQECWRTALDSYSVHRLSESSVASRSDLIKFGKLKRLIHAVSEPMKPEITPDPCLHDVQINWQSPDTPWMARLFIALFTNCLRHGHPLHPVKVDITTKKKGVDRDLFHLEVWNKKFKKGNESDTAHLDKLVVEIATREILVYLESNQVNLKDVLEDEFPGQELRSILNDVCYKPKLRSRKNKFGTHEAVEEILQRLREDGQTSKETLLQTIDGENEFTTTMPIQYRYK